MAEQESLNTRLGSKRLTPERIAGIKAFKDEDIFDYLELTDEELKKLRPRHPEYFKPVKGIRQKPAAENILYFGWRCA